MSEIDLIPQDYRNQLTQHSMVRRYLTVFAALNAIVFIVAVALAQASNRVADEAEQLKSKNAITQQQQAQLEQLQQQRTEYERQLRLLRGLRAGAAVNEIFSVIDRSLDGDDLWFIDWNFQRAGVVVDGEQRGVETGYFIIVDEQQNPNEGEWQVETRMTIHGQAKDHQALSTFVRSLFDQSEIKDVNVQRTSATAFGSGRVVEFDMTIILNSAVRDI